MSSTLIIITLPLGVLLLYLLFGINFRNRKYFERKHKRSLDWFATRKDDRIDKLINGDASGIKERYRPFAHLLMGEVLPGVASGNDVEIITEGPRKLELLLEDIRNAKEYIHFQYYLFGDDASGRAVRLALEQKAREGVKVRLLHENVANYDTKRSFYNRMRKVGVEVVRVYNPKFRILRFITSLNYRNHRKIVIIDGKIGYTGGMNIKDRYFNSWRDTHMRITGPAVAQLQYIFLDSWLTSGGLLDRQPEYFFPDKWANEGLAGVGAPKDKNALLKNKCMQITPDEPDSKHPILQLSYIWAISHAKDYIWIQSPYFVPPVSVLDALKTAALCGTDVRVMVPRDSENWFMGPAVKAYYKECLEAGIRIFERGGGFIHSKTFVADDYLSSIGTANLDNRSLNINYEVNTYIYDQEAALYNKSVFLQDLEISEEIKLEDLQKIPARKKLFQKFIRIFASQL